MAETIPDPIKDQKKHLRAAALARRDALDPTWRADASHHMAARASAELSLPPGAPVSGFWPMRSEVDVVPLMRALAAMGARPCLPAILDKTTIVFREWRDGGDLVDMGFGTFGPGPDAPALDPVLMLVPLAAFDRRGHRIGYGAGYYDRAIAALGRKGTPPRLLGIAFDCQEVDRVPDEPHDVPLPELLTETGFRRFGETIA